MIELDASWPWHLVKISYVVNSFPDLFYLDVQYLITTSVMFATEPFNLDSSLTLMAGSHFTASRSCTLVTVILWDRSEAKMDFRSMHPNIAGSFGKLYADRDSLFKFEHLVRDHVRVACSQRVSRIYGIP